MPSFAQDPFVYLRQRAIRGGGSGGAAPDPVVGIFLVRADGTFLTRADGTYLLRASQNG